jgi:hypothetical protein
MLSHLLSTLGVLVNFTIAKNVSKKEVSEERKRLKKIHKKEDPETIEKILIDYLTKKHSSNSGILPPGMVVNKKFLQKEKLDKLYLDLYAKAEEIQSKLNNKNLTKHQLCFIFNTLINMLNLTEEDFLQFHRDFEKYKNDELDEDDDEVNL